MYEFEKTGQVLPVLVGTTMADTSGSGQEVPILGAQKHPQTGKIIPLGGTMEDPEGAGKISDIAVSYIHLIWIVVIFVWNSCYYIVQVFIIFFFVFLVFQI